MVSPASRQGFFGGSVVFFRSLAAVFAALVLTGCSPEYNWREVTLADGLVVAIFPDKPRVQTKTLPFAGHDIQFSLTGTSLGDAVYAVGHAPLPAAIGNDATQRAHIYRQILLSFYGNFGQEPPSVLPQPGQRFQIEGNGPSGLIRLEGIIWLHSKSVTEALVTAPAADYPTEQAAEFLRAVKAPGM